MFWDGMERRNGEGKRKLGRERKQRKWKRGRKRDRGTYGGRKQDGTDRWNKWTEEKGKGKVTEAEVMVLDGSEVGGRNRGGNFGCRVVQEGTEAKIVF